MERRRGWTWHGGFTGLALVGLIVGAPGAWAAAGQSLGLAVGLSTWYDSNLLQYSDPQLRELDAWDPVSQPGRFAIESHDDVTFNPSLALTWEGDEGHGRRHSVRLKGDGDYHARNRTVDFRSAGLTWRESFAGGQRLALRGYLLPAYYLRQLHVTGTGFAPGVYERAQFDLAVGEAAWTQSLRRGTQLGFGYQFERRSYTPFFAERTSGTHQGELTLGFTRLPHRAALELLGGYRKSLADGRNLSAGALLSTADVSYHGWQGGLSGRTEFSRRAGLRTGADLAYRLEQRSYDAERPQDTSHFGRRDLKHTIEAGLRAQLRSHWTLRGFDRFESNDARYGGAVTLASDPGSYRQNLVGAEIVWSGDLWARARGAAPPDDEGGR
jgi:hypothetical protein